MKRFAPVLAILLCLAISPAIKADELPSSAIASPVPSRAPVPYWRNYVPSKKLLTIKNQLLVAVKRGDEDRVSWLQKRLDTYKELYYANVVNSFTQQVELGEIKPGDPLIICGHVVGKVKGGVLLSPAGIDVTYLDVRAGWPNQKTFAFLQSTKKNFCRECIVGTYIICGVVVAKGRYTKAMLNGKSVDLPILLYNAYLGEF